MKKATKKLDKKTQIHVKTTPEHTTTNLFFNCYLPRRNYDLLPDELILDPRKIIKDRLIQNTSLAMKLNGPQNNIANFATIDFLHYVDL